MLISEINLQEVRRLHEQGLHLQAYNLANSICPLSDWEGTEAILLASHLAFQLGAVKASEKWVNKAWRKDKKHPKALFNRAADISQTKGALPTLIFLNKYGADFQSDRKHTAWWYSLHAQIYAQLRDFKTADQWLEKAVESASEESWVWVAKSYILELQDRYEEALENAGKAYLIDSSYRATVSQLAHILSLSERYDEALEVLSKASRELENVWVVKQLAELQTELDLPGEAFSSLERVLALTPVRESEFEQWLYAALSDAAYLNGDIQKAISFADKSSTPYHLKIKERLENLKGSEARVHLKLGFVRQHYLTCAPATLTNISRFWKKKAEHLELANEMCYEGTPAYKERIWAAENGWETREFTVNWKNTVELINRNVPFTLATIQPGNGHLQAIIGYDERRRTMLVRDPFFQRFDEYSAEELLENQKSNGPRGMALVPVEKAELLQDLDLQESRQYDFLFRVDSSLEKHDREKALLALEEMEKEFPEHRLTWSARWALARYDSNTPKLLKAIEGLLKIFPDDINLKLSYLSVSQEFIPRGERLKKLEEFSKAQKTDPLFWQMFGYELGLDANSHARALRWLYKSLRKIPGGLTIRIIADIFWSKRRFDESAELYRFAACLNDKDEQFSYSYFLAARFLKKEDEAIRFLYDRFERFGHQSNLPIRSLFHALREIGRTIEAFEVLEKALKKRADDSELKLFAAELKARFGKKEEAEKLLKEVENQSPRNIWLRTAALIAELPGDLQKSLEYWREIVKLEPSSQDAHGAIAFLLSALEGRKSAQNYLRKVSREFPFDRNLQKLRLEYLTEETTEAIAVLRDLVRISPNDAWSFRDLSHWLCKVKKYEKALEAAQKAVEIDPNDSLNHCALGGVLGETEKKSEAAKAFEKALSLSVDTNIALNGWLKLCRTNQEKLAVLKFVREELSKQTNFGDGVMAYREQAKRLLEPETLLAELKNYQAENKNIWFATSVVVQQLVDMHKLDEALELAEQNTKKFPLIYQVWHDLSLIHKLRGENESEISALQQAVSVNSFWSFGFQQLGEALQRGGRFAEAEATLREAIARMPLDHFLHRNLAEVLWKLDKREAALNSAKHAVSIQPDYEWAWQIIKNWGEELKQPDLAAELARELTLQKPKDVNAWLRLAQVLDTGKFSQTQLEAAEEALRLDPQNVLGLAIKANSLADARRFDEAIAICQTTTADGHHPERLRYVQAGIEANRGNYKESIHLLEELVASSPEYYGGWERLALIYRNLDDKKNDYLRVTREMTRLAPQEATAFGYLGEAYLQKNQRNEAKKAFHQDLIISPDYGFVGFSLFDLYFEDDDTDNCRQVLELLNNFVKDEKTLIRQIAFYAQAGDLEQTADLWKKLWFMEKAQIPQFDYAFKQFRDADLLDKDFVWQTLHDIYLDANVNPLIGNYIIKHEWDKKGEDVCLEWLVKLQPSEKVWTEAVIKFMEILLTERSYALTKFFNDKYDELRSNDAVWASTGYMLNAMKEYKIAQNWFSDWHQREQIEAWMLWNYSIALRRLNEHQEATSINQKALEVVPDETINKHLMMIGLDEIHIGNYEKAEKLFTQINPQNMSEWDRFFYFLLQENLAIYHQVQNGLLKEAEQLAGAMIKTGLSMPDLWNDNIIRNYFEKSSKSVLALCQNRWLKLRLRLKILLAKPKFR